MPTPRLRAALLSVALLGPSAAAQGPAASPEINKPFQDPDVPAFVRRFESDDREVYARRESIVAALRLRPRMAVADVGAGTGLFTRLMAERVGPGGKVYAVDVSPAFLTHIASEAKRRGHAQVVTIRGTQSSTGLPPASVELAFLCDVYHHVEDPPALLASIHRALRPGGALVVVDFDRAEGRSSEFVLKHVRAGRAVFTAEIEAAGFERVPTRDAPALKENFFLRFRRKESPAPPGSDRPAKTPR